MKLRVLLLTDHHIVVNKPPYLFSQPPVKKSLYTNTVIYHVQKQNPSLSLLLPVHRLDYNVSGCICLARTAQAARSISKNLKQGGNVGWPITRKYICLAQNISDGAQLALDNNEQIIVDEPIDDKPASTRLKLLRKIPGKTPFSLIILQLKTGRKHQIRKHLNLLNYAIVGDQRYGYIDPNQKFYRNSPIALHSAWLNIKIGLSSHPVFAPLTFNETGVWNAMIKEGLIDSQGLFIPELQSEIESF